MTARPTARPIATPLARPIAGAGEGGSAATPLLLDTYTGASAAYSLRRLRTAYSGACIRVRRSTDNTEQDIGFTNNALDTATLLTFCGAGNGFVTQWYDQSGTGNNATQATTTLQPQIVASGVLLQSSGMPAIRTIDSALSCNSWSTGRLDMFFVRETSDSQYVTISNTANRYDWVANAGNPATDLHLAFGSPSLRVNAAVSSAATHGALQTAMNGRKLLATVNASLANWTSVLLFNYPAAPAFNLNCFAQELIAWNSDQSANTAAIEASINSYWSVY